MMRQQYNNNNNNNNETNEDENDYYDNGTTQQQPIEDMTLSSNNNNTTISSNTSLNDTNEYSIITPVIGCILITETAERFVYFGFRAMLIFYFRDGLLYTETQSISYYAYTTAIAYYSPLLGSIVSDGYYGLYNTILYFSILYIIGLFILLLASWITIIDSSSTKDDDDDDDKNYNSWWLLLKRITSFVGLFMVCIGTGGIKPCVSAFGANQVDSTTSSSKNTITNITNNNTDDFNYSDNYNDNNNNANKKLVTLNNPPSKNSSRLDENNNSNNNTIDDNNPENIDTTTNLNERNVRLFFSYFYFCINLGAVTSIGIVPIVRAHYGFKIAFIIPFICMVIAVLLFTSKRHDYKHISKNANSDQNNNNILTTLKLTIYIIYQQIKSSRILEKLRYNARYCCYQYYSRIPIQQPSFEEERGTTGSSSIYYRRNTDDDPDVIHPTNATTNSITIQRKTSKSSDTYEENDNDDDDEFHRYDPNNGNNFDDRIQDDTNYFTKEQKSSYEDAAQIVHILPILFMLPIYWCLYDQQGSVWTLQASRMYLPYGITPEQLLLVNPIEIMIFIPLFGRLNVSQLKRMLWGMILTAAAFIVSGIVESVIESNQYVVDGSTTGEVTSNINVFWQLPQLTLLAIGEIFVSVTGLEFAYSTSPHHLKALVLGLFLATSAMGDSIGGLLYSTVFAHTNRATAMYTCSALMIINLLIFHRVAKWYKNKSYTDYLPQRKNGGIPMSQRNNNTRYKDNDGRKYHADDADHIELQDRPGIMT